MHVCVRDCRLFLAFLGACVGKFVPLMGFFTAFLFLCVCLTVQVELVCELVCVCVCVCVCKSVCECV